MKIEDLKRIEEAPERGTILAYTRKEVLFHSYESLENICRELRDETLLEMHLFDEKKEYRCIATESKCFPEGVIEYIAEFSDAFDVYKEKTLVEAGYEADTLTVMNHIRYEESNGMAVIDDYRLTCQEERR